VETGGEAFLSNAIVDGKYLLRMCIVNFRTSVEDIEALPRHIAEVGARLFAQMQEVATGGNQGRGNCGPARGGG
jgi:hypothetical protein